MSEEAKYVYAKGPNGELLKRMQGDGVDVEQEVYEGGEWKQCDAKFSELTEIDEVEVKALIGQKASEKTYPPNFVPVGEAKPIIDRDEVWVH